MKLNKLFACIMAAFIATPVVFSQSPTRPAGFSESGVAVDGLYVNIRQMPDSTRKKITETMNKLDGSDGDKSILASMGIAVGNGIVSGLVDAIVSETYNLAQYRKRQKEEWRRMIQNENNYTDSITAIKGLKDFYNKNSFRGALDPSDINFDGIEIRGMRDGQEVIYMSCSIDSTKLDHLFNHSKFNLVLDSLAFYPYQCHLPNITANGIKTMNDIRKGKAKVKGDTIVRQEFVKGDTILRPGIGGNGFSFDERNNLRVGIDLTIYSSWINEAIQVHNNVELGNFKFNISIPDSIGGYKYSRKKEIAKATEFKDPAAQAEYLNSHLIQVEGDSFVVPRSYMPINNGKPMWGTGEYNIKVKLRESCELADNSDKAKHWKEDYKRLRQMQNKSGEIREYFQTIWNQYGNSLVKSTYKTALSTAATELTSPILGGGSSSGAKSSGGGGQMP